MCCRQSSLIGCLFLSLLLVACTQAQPKKYPAVSDKETDQKVFEHTLSNGLKVLVKPVFRSPVMSAQLWYKVGSSYEYAGISGISHMLEHMMFKGTEQHPDQTFSTMIERNGGSHNAFTGKDYTAYYQNIASNQLALVMELEADRMRALAWDDKEFVKERNVVMEERRLRTEDNASNRLYEQFFLNAFDLNAYRNPVIGFQSDIQNYQMQDAQRWFDKWYAPNNATLVVVGAVDPAEVFRLSEQYYGGLPAKEVPKLKPREEPKNQGERRRTIFQDAGFSQVMVGYQVPSVLSLVEQGEDPNDAYVLDVISSLLGHGRSARLKNQRIAVQSSASYNLYARLPTIFFISAVLASDSQQEKLESAVLEQIRLLKVELVKQQELERIKAQTKAHHVYQKDSLFYQGYELGLLETIGLGWRTSEAYTDAIDKITVEQIQRVSQRYFKKSNRRVVSLKPIKYASQ